MDVSSFSEIEDKFLDYVNTYVYCNVATVDTKNRPRSRIMHPVWEGSTGWIISWQATLKSKHIANNPHVSLAYFCHDKNYPMYIDCTATWETDRDEMWRVWDYYKVARQPMGFDPEPHFGDIDHEHFGLLKLIPWRIELYTLGKESIIWKTQ
jgi:general stress protein 26